MSYIRTDIGIFESEKRNQNPKMFECLWGSVLKEADTIEDLCDEFVFNSDVSNYVIDEKHIEHIKATILKIYKENDETDYVKAMHPKFYGAVWCEWGLKYVAKVNDKGELELL